jgi:small subunit ribosomal protein S7
MGAFDKKKTLAEALADEIEFAAKGDVNSSYAIKKRDETERMARSAR